MIEIRQGSRKENGLDATENKEINRSEEQKEVEKIGFEECKSSCQPKNFRQIGSPQGSQKIYFEDYVYTYLHPAMETTEEMRVCILIGRVEKDERCHYIFVNGAMEMPDINFAGITPIFSERTREMICNMIRQHFEGGYLVGWYLDIKGNPPKLTPEFERLHRNFFGGRDKIFLLSDTLNREEKIFACDNNAIWQKDGYYIYYEKNPKMQEYMIGTREQSLNTIEPEKVMDEALKNYRELLLQKEDGHSHSWRLAWYSTGFLLVLTVCVLGVNMLNNYEKMKNIEDAITVMSNRTQDATESLVETEATESSVIIESVKGNVTKETETETGQTETTGQGSDAQSSTEQTSAQSADTQNTDAQNADTETAQTDASAQVLTEAETIQLQGYYIVQKGDNLAAISRKIYGSTDKMSDICKKNAIENSDEIYAGQKLMLP